MISGVTLTIIMVVILFVLLVPGQWIFVATRHSEFDILR